MFWKLEKAHPMFRSVGASSSNTADRHLDCTTCTTLGRDRSYYDVRRKPRLQQELNIQLAREQLQTPHFLENSSRRKSQKYGILLLQPKQCFECKNKTNFWRCQFPFKVWEMHVLEKAIFSSFSREVVWCVVVS